MWVLHLVTSAGFPSLFSAGFPSLFSGRGWNEDIPPVAERRPDFGRDVRGLDDIEREETPGTQTGFQRVPFPQQVVVGFPRLIRALRTPVVGVKTWTTEYLTGEETNDHQWIKTQHGAYVP